ncbi:MAG: hypothetical protein MI756_13360 [Chromatiales bacterium]|nr:hypothetical protein [Chromatiales bacterium]
MADLKQHSLTLSAVLSLVLSACGGGGGGGDNNTSNTTTSEPDMVIMNRIDDATGFMVAFNGGTASHVDNANGVELNPATGIQIHNGMVYTVGSLYSDDVVKYSLNGNVFTKEGEFSTGEGARAGSLIFVNDNKAYAVTYHSSDLLIFDPQTMTVTGAIDLSEYALGEGDTNPNATGGVIRDGKLYLGLAQIDTLQTFRCQAGASLIIIDVATDVVDKHIQDDRACFSGTLEPNAGIIMDELGDIYVNNYGSYGYYPGLQAGYLRIRNGADEFDPDYYFSITDLQLPEVPGETVSYSYRDVYAGDGIIYSNLFVPGLTSNPPDYANDKNYMAYKIDLYNQTVTAIDVPATAGWSASSVIYQEKVMYGRSTDDGAGMFMHNPSDGTMAGDQTPSITTEGSPVWMVNL